MKNKGLIGLVIIAAVLLAYIYIIVFQSNLYADSKGIFYLLLSLGGVAAFLIVKALYKTIKAD